MAAIIIPFLFLILISSSQLFVSAGLCNKEDKKALIAIRDSFGNPYHFASWTDTSACCDWYGVECNEAGRVYDLFIITDNLSGTIPPAVGDLPYLQVLEFHKLPNLVGSIPPEITKLKMLRFLWISWTNITGPVPDFLSNMPSLQQLDLSFNNISGAIPASLGDLSNLSSVDISRNHLTGTLPPTLFSKASSQPYLILSHNNLTGEIPPSYGNVSFTKIDLSRNHLTGDASMLFGQSKPAQYIDISRNEFDFSLTDVKFPEGLDVLDMNHNMIYGSIPSQVVDLPSLQLFNVSYNRLCGAIPTGGQLGQFDEYSYLHNKCLCGTPLPPC